ncbi:MAG: cellulose biosynthesis cyclic di-GMP-binding regulatory protein BcsB [Chloroflexi bacterium]|nr:cellulose biosynthesis cyclic di-GMP-binding regulatory protein BcsB [Chloroflexota bacterium]
MVSGWTSSSRFARVTSGLLGALVIAVALLLGTATTALAQGEPTKPPSEVSFKDLGMVDSTLRGRLATYLVYFAGNGVYELGDGNEIRLIFSHSELLSPRSSALSVVWNGVPLKNMSLDKSNVDRTRLVIPIPRDKVDPDVNELRLIFYMQLSEDECFELDNPSRASTVYSESSVFLNILPNVGQIPQIQYELGSGTTPGTRSIFPRTGNVRIVLPAEPTRAELTAAATIAARTGRDAGIKPIVIRASRAGELDNVGRQDHLIVIGNAARNPLIAELDARLPLKTSGATFLRPDGASVPSDHGVLQAAGSPWRPDRGVLLVGGSTDEAVLRASRALASETYRKLMLGTFAIVDQAVPVLPTAAPESSERQISFADLGNEDATVRGLGEQSFSLNFELPAIVDKQPYNLNLYLTTSPLLDFNRSNVRVVLNKVTIHSIRAADGVRRHFLINLPAANLRPGVNTLEFLAAHHVPRDPDCGPIADERAWTVIHRDSSITFAQADTQGRNSLLNLPYPFLRNGALEETLLVVASDATEWGPALTFAADLGRRTRVDMARLEAALPNQVTDNDWQSRHLILYGTPPPHPMITGLGSRLPLQFNDRGDRLLQNREGVLFAGVDTSRLGVIEIISNPRAADRVILVVSATTSEMLPLVNTAVRQGGLAGNVATVSQNVATGLPARPGEDPTRPRVAAADLEVEGGQPSAATAGRTSRLLSPAIIATGLVGLITLGLLGMLGLQLRGR